MKSASTINFPTQEDRASAGKNAFPSPVSAFLLIKKSETTTAVCFANLFCLFLLIAAAPHKGPSPSYYQPKSYWKMDA